MNLPAAIMRRPANRRPSRLGPTDVLDWWGRTDLDRNSWLFVFAKELR